MSAPHFSGNIPTSPQFSVGVGLQDTGWHPGSWFRIPDAQEVFTSTYWGQLALTAEHGGLDFVTFDDSLGLKRHGQLEASLVASWVGARTSSVGLLPTLTTTHTEPFHLSKNLATLDHISEGRAGWLVEVSRTQEESALFGRGHPHVQHPPEDSDLSAAELYAESEEAVDVVRRLWDSWEDDAEIRDTRTGRFIDRDKLRYINYDGTRFSVKGPSITPRPPQGHPVVSYQGHSEPVVKAAATSADVLFTDPSVRSEAPALLHRVRETERIFGRIGPRLKIYADIAVLVDHTVLSARDRWRALAESAGEKWTPAHELVVGDAASVAEVVESYRDLGFDGVRLKPAEHTPDGELIAELLVPELIRREVLAPGTSSGHQLRQRLGLGEAPNRYATAPHVTRGRPGRSAERASASALAGGGA